MDIISIAFGKPIEDVKIGEYYYLDLIYNIISAAEYPSAGPTAGDVIKKLLFVAKRYGKIGLTTTDRSEDYWTDYEVKSVATDETVYSYVEESGHPFEREERVYTDAQFSVVVNGETKFVKLRFILQDIAAVLEEAAKVLRMQCDEQTVLYY